MKQVHFFRCAIALFLLSSCKVSCNMGSAENQGSKGLSVSSENSSGSLQGAIIRNDIDLEAHDVKVATAYLTDEQGNVLEKNETRVGEKIMLIVQLDTGWTKYGSKSYVGASERITSSAGAVVLDVEDLFSIYDASGIDANDGRYLSVSAMITEAGPDVTDFNVKFRIWDKKGQGEISGKYRFKIIP